MVLENNVNVATPQNAGSSRKSKSRARRNRRQNVANVQNQGFRKIVGKPVHPTESNRLSAALQHIKHKRNMLDVGTESNCPGYDSFMATLTSNPQASKKELVLQAIDFFEYGGETQQALRQYKFNPNSFNLLPPVSGALGGPDRNVGKITGCKVWALPSFIANGDGSGPSAATVQVLFGVPINNFQQLNVQPDPADNTQDNYRGTAGQTATILTPTSVSDWVEVGSWKSSKLFSDSNFGPVYDDFGNQCLFTYSVVDPNAATQSAIKLQFMIEVTVEQTLPVLGTVKADQVATQSSDAWSGATTADVSDQPAMVSLVRLQNSI